MILYIERYKLPFSGYSHNLADYVKQVYDLSQYSVVVIRGTTYFIVKDERYNLAGKYIDSRLFKLYYE